MKCELCETIWKNVSHYTNQFENSYDEVAAIVMKNGMPYLYIPCEDYYYSGTVMQINYCPKCGRDLVTHCEDCVNYGWDMPECSECMDNNFKYFKSK